MYQHVMFVRPNSWISCILMSSLCILIWGFTLKKTWKIKGHCTTQRGCFRGVLPCREQQTQPLMFLLQEFCCTLNLDEERENQHMNSKVLHKISAVRIVGTSHSLSHSKSESSCESSHQLLSMGWLYLKHKAIWYKWPLRAQLLKQCEKSCQCTSNQGLSYNQFSLFRCGASAMPPSAISKLQTAVTQVKQVGSARDLTGSAPFLSGLPWFASRVL